METQIEYTKHESLTEMAPQDRELIESAREAARNSYSPYSHFAVGAAARLLSGRVVCGTNIESEAFPAGVCAERALLFHAAGYYPTDPIVSLVVTSISTSAECYPCGVCRQSLLDAERRQGSPMRIIMAGESSATVVDSATTLLPFSFKL